MLYLFLEGNAQNFDAEVINYSTLCEVVGDKLTQTDSVTIQINNRSGDRYTEIEIPYSKLNKVSNINGWIESTDGNKVRYLKKSDILDKSAISNMSLYEDDYVKVFQFKHNIYPYKITYTYQTTSTNFITIARWSPIIYNSIPTKSAKLKIIVPKGFQLNRYVYRCSDSSFLSTAANDILEWKVAYISPVKPEIFSQKDYFIPYVIVAHENFTYGPKGSTKDWVSYGNWQYSLLEGIDVLPESEKNTISGFIKNTTDRKEITKILYHYLQDNARYINVSIGIGGLKPYPASYVAINKYGDCKALSNYLKAMLNYAGIESFYANVYADEQPHSLIKNYAGPQFNHVILAVPLNNDTVWLECTSNTNPFGYIGTFTQNRKALLVIENNSKIVSIPALQKKDTHDSYKLSFDLAVNGNAKLKFRFSCKGKNFEFFNQLNSELNEAQKDENIREYMPFDNYEVIDWKLEKSDRDSTHIELNASLNLYKFLNPIGAEYYLNLFPIRIPRFTNPTKRKLPVLLPYPICRTDTIEYILPMGYEMKSKPDTISITSQFGNYKIIVNTLNGQIQVYKKFELYQGSYSTEQYPEFYAFINAVQTADKKKFVIKPVI